MILGTRICTRSRTAASMLPKKSWKSPRGNECGVCLDSIDLRVSTIFTTLAHQCCAGLQSSACLYLAMEPDTQHSATTFKNAQNERSTLWQFPAAAGDLQEVMSVVIRAAHVATADSPPSRGVSACMRSRLWAVSQVLSPQGSLIQADNATLDDVALQFCCLHVSATNHRRQHIQPSP